MKALLLLLLCLAPARAGDAPTWAGVPLDALPGLGLEAPSLLLEGSGWQAPLQGGGFARLSILPDAESAAHAFEAQRLAVATVSLGEPRREGERLYAGDGEGIVLVLDRNLLLLLRDPSGRARERADLLLDAAVAEPPPGEGAERRLDGKLYRWDACGRLEVLPAEGAAPGEPPG